MSKEKIKFAKGPEPNFSTQTFRITNLIEMRPCLLYELEDLKGTPIDRQFLQVELTTFHVTRRTVYGTDKILDKRVKRGILEYLVRWRGYSMDFDSWIPASSVKDVRRAKKFYVTLFSNASNDLYPNNTIATFTAELARPTELGFSDN